MFLSLADHFAQQPQPRQQQQRGPGGLVRVIGAVRTAVERRLAPVQVKDQVDARRLAALLHEMRADLEPIVRVSVNVDNGSGRGQGWDSILLPGEDECPRVPSKGAAAGGGAGAARGEESGSSEAHSLRETEALVRMVQEARIMLRSPQFAQALGAALDAAWAEVTTLANAMFEGPGAGAPVVVAKLIPMMSNLSNDILVTPKNVLHSISQTHQVAAFSREIW